MGCPPTAEAPEERASREAKRKAEEGEDADQEEQELGQGSANRSKNTVGSDLVPKIDEICRNQKSHSNHHSTP